MRSVTITPPGPVFNLQTLRDQVRIEAIGETHPDDGALLRYAAAAQAFAEHYTGMAIGEQTREAIADDFYAFAAGPLPGGRPEVVEAVEFRPVGGAWTALDPSYFYYDEYDRVIRYWGTLALPTHSHLPNAVRVRYSIGSDVPPDVRAAMLLMVAELYLNRETSSQVKLEVVPVSVHALLAPHRLELGV